MKKVRSVKGGYSEKEPHPEEEDSPKEEAEMSVTLLR